jgi:predicted dehydrogenase
MPIRIAIIGFGKIARDEHLPAIGTDPRFEAVAAVSPRSSDVGGLRRFTSQRELLDSMPGGIDAVAVATPPGVRQPIVAEALEAGLHVLIEKPPAATLGEVDDMERRARAAGRTLFTAWHSQHAGGVEGARRALAGKTVAALEIVWHEDVRKWHPGQEWIWAPGGFGVFDPGINALSIASRILPMPLFVREARLSYPQNRQTPIAARIGFAGGFTADFDWRRTEGEQWTIRVETQDGTKVQLRSGGAELLVDGEPQPVDSRREYPGLYDRFAGLIEAGEMEVDREPLRIVADAFLVGARDSTEPFVWDQASG